VHDHNSCDAHYCSNDCKQRLSQIARPGEDLGRELDCNAMKAKVVRNVSLRYWSQVRPQAAKAITLMPSDTMGYLQNSMLSHRIVRAWPGNSHGADVRNFRCRILLSSLPVVGSFGLPADEERRVSISSTRHAMFRERQLI